MTDLDQRVKQLTKVNSWSLQELSLDVTVADEVDSSSLIQLPVCLNSSRANLIFTVNLPLAAGQKKTDFHERGVAILASTALNTRGEKAFDKEEKGSKTFQTHLAP